MTLRQTPFRKAPEFFGIANHLALLGAEKPHQSFLHKIVHIGAAVAHMIQNLIAELEAQAFDGRFGQVHVFGQVRWIMAIRSDADSVLN